METDRIVTHLPKSFALKIKNVTPKHPIQPWRFRNMKHINIMKTELKVPKIRYDNPQLEPLLVTQKMKAIRLFEDEKKMNEMSNKILNGELSNNLLLYVLTQKDIHRRRLHINIPEFCVGSIVKVEYYSHTKDGDDQTFTGLCIKKNPKINSIGHTFTLMNSYNNNVVVRMTFFTYDVKIKSIDVIRHTSMTRDQINAFKQLPPVFNNHSLIQPIPYSKEPTKFIFSNEEEQAIRKYLENKIVNIVMRERPKERNFRKLTNDTSFTHPKPHWINLK